MEWLDRMNKAMNYIELNLAEDISYDQLAQIACCSTYHFQRMFSFITGVPLSEYIRRRRLTIAAFELQTSNAKVIDLAIKYGYESPEAFSRAFKNLHGIAPVSACDVGVSMKAFPKMTFSISIKGVSELNYRIEQKERFEVFGLALKTTVINGQCYKDIPAFWTACGRNGLSQALVRSAGKKSDELMDAGVIYAHHPNGDMSYMLGCIKRDNVVAPEYTV